VIVPSGLSSLFARVCPLLRGGSALRLAGRLTVLAVCHVNGAPQPVGCLITVEVVSLVLLLPPLALSVVSPQRLYVSWKSGVLRATSNHFGVGIDSPPALLRAHDRECEGYGPVGRVGPKNLSEL